MARRHPNRWESRTYYPGREGCFGCLVKAFIVFLALGMAGAIAAVVLGLA